MTGQAKEKAGLAAAWAGAYDRAMFAARSAPFMAAPPVAAFALCGAVPALMLIAGAMQGGVWLWAGVLWVALAGPAADAALARAFADAAPDRRFPMADAGLACLGVTHFALLLTALWAFSGDWLTQAERVALFLGAGMYAGQVGHAVAHELIHRHNRALFGLGAAIYVSMLFGHHVSAHRLVHHRHVATVDDPNSARLGEGFWQFAGRAWAGSFRKGLAAERRLSARRPGRVNPYKIWVAGGLACITAVGLIFGPRALVDYLGLCIYAQMQILLSDYVQHYGLSRRIRPDGRPEPVGPRHAWDSPHPVSSLMLVNAPRHSDHHMHPQQPYPALRLNHADRLRPLLPLPIGVMAAAALVPPLWRRLMDRRVLRMRQAD